MIAASSDRVRVLQFLNTTARGGAEEHVLTLVRNLDRDRFSTDIVCPPEVAELLAPDVPDDVEVFPVTVRSPKDFGEGRRLFRLLRERQYDVLHSHLFCSNRCAAPIGWWARVPLVVETTHIRELWRTGFLKGSFALDRMIGRMTDRFIAVSYANGRYLTETKGLPESKVVVIQNGTNLERFAGAPPSIEGLREELGLAPSTRVLLVVGRLEPQKGHRVLFDALAEFRSELPDYVLLMIGDGELRQELEQHAQTLGLAERARFLGFRPDVERWLALADVMVLPSFYEGLPLAAIESLAAGTPVVASAVDGTPEVVVSERTGLTVPPGEPTALGAALVRILGDEELRARMGREGARFVLENFDERRQVKQTEDLYWESRARRKAVAP